MDVSEPVQRAGDQWGQRSQVQTAGASDVLQASVVQDAGMEVGQMLDLAGTLAKSGDRDRSNKLEQAALMLRQLKRAKVNPNKLASALHWLAKPGLMPSNVQQVVKAVSALRCAGVDLNEAEPLLNTLAKARDGSSNKLALARELMTELQNAGVKDLNSLAPMMTEIAEAGVDSSGTVALVARLLTQLKIAGMDLNMLPQMLTAIEKVSAQSNMFTAARQMVAELQNAGVKDLNKLTPMVAEVAQAGVDPSGNVAVAERLLSQLKNSGLDLNSLPEMLATMEDATARSNIMAGVGPLLRKLKKAGMDLNALPAMVTGLAQANVDASGKVTLAAELLSHLKNAGMDLNKLPSAWPFIESLATNPSLAKLADEVPFLMRSLQRAGADISKVDLKHFVQQMGPLQLQGDTWNMRVLGEGEYAQIMRSMGRG